jgi:pSer/pThr/pTyr-binding forkhead associated (FHA) protein
MADQQEPVQAFLVLRGVPRSLWECPILPKVQTIGREDTCDVRIGDRSVSRKHARVWQEGGVLRICDVRSTNGTFVNGRAASEAELKIGDAICLGQLVLEVGGPEEPAGPGGSGPTADISTGQAAGVDLCSLRPDRLPLREEAAAMYSLGVTLGSCAQSAEALQCCLDWLREWLGVERAAVVTRARSGLRVEAETRAPGPSALQLHWPVVHEAFAAKAGPEHSSGDGRAFLAPNGLRKAFAAAVPGVKPARVVYAEWSTSGADDKEGYPALIRAAAQALGSALPRMGRDRAAPRADGPIRPRESPAPPRWWGANRCGPCSTS